MQNGNVRFPQDENFISLAGMTALGQILSFKRGRYYSSLGSTAAVWKSPVERRPDPDAAPDARAVSNGVPIRTER